MYQELYEIYLICLHTSETHFLPIWMKSQFRLKKNYEPLLEGISAYAEHVANYFAVFSKRGGQMF